MSQQMLALLLPMEDVARPDAKLLVRLLDVLAVQSCRLVTAYEGSGDWDAGGLVVRERSDQFKISVSEYLQLAARNESCLISAELDGRLMDLAESIRSQHGAAFAPWFPFVGVLSIGPHSYPDLEFENTRWRGQISLGISGDRLGDVTAVGEALANDALWLQLASTISVVLGVRVDTEIIAYY